MMFIHDLGQQVAGLAVPGMLVAAFGVDAVMNGLAEQSVRLLLANEAEEIPGAVGHHHAVHFVVIMHGVQDCIEGILGGGCRQRGEHRLGPFQVLVAHRIAKGLAGDGSRREHNWCHWV